MPLLLSPALKGYPHHAPALPVSAIGAQGWHLFSDDWPLPLAVLREPALGHNIGWMQALVQRAGAELAPHGKTTLSPELFARQLQAGAWGITFANVWQWRQALAAGLEDSTGQPAQVLLANQVIAPANLHEIQRLLAERPGRRAPFLVDDPAQIAAAQVAWKGGAPLEVLVEWGVASEGGRSGRTGCRTIDQALNLCQQVAACPALRLAGLSTYEGLWASGQAQDNSFVALLMQQLADLARQADAEALFAGPEILLSAGGSALYDLVLQAWAQQREAGWKLSRPVRCLLRSGCYVSHDDGSYQRWGQVVEQRLGCSGQGLQAALEVWAWVQSGPEPGLALLGVGKRDISFDMGLPVPRRWCPAGSRQAQAAPAGWQISALNDQHAYLRWNPDEMAGPSIGDRIGLGISHPCTTFDKWRWMPVVDSEDRVISAITTLF